ncbi:MAG: penicillin-binding protein 2 [Myxococcales bacterium]|nr:penicillin-binding protein 2 [Myxococcales bacterium]
MALISPRREVGEFRKRYKWMALVVVIVFMLFSVRACQLQLFEGDRWSAIAADNVTRTVSLPATRGIIRDTAGRVLADNRTSYKVYITPQMFRPERDLPLLAELMDLSAKDTEALADRVAKVPARRRTHQIEVYADVPRDHAAALTTHAKELRGVDVVAVPQRTYPFGVLGSHAIGYLNEVSAEDLERLGEDYRAGDRVGRTGIERAWENYLRGRRGFLRVFVDARGTERQHHENEADTERKDPVAGKDVTLTLDMELMRIVQSAFRGHPSGAVFVVDVRTGRIRALYSKPSYNLNEMNGRLSTERFAELSENAFRPLIDKTLYESYFPGSTFKVVTALAALGDHLVGVDERIECPGYYEVGKRRFRCSQAHGEVDVRKAIIQSCNVYFWKVAERVGIERINRYAHDLGFASRTGVGINTETAGFMASREWYEKQGNRFLIGYTLNTAIGQGNTRVTLAQLGMAYAAIANGGVLYVPQLVERVAEPGGDVIATFEPKVRRRVNIEASDLDYLVEGLEGVVNNPNGTAYDARVEGGVLVAGKTGTAQVSRRAPKAGEDPKRSDYFNRDHAWFAGFAPARDPEIAIVVLVEHGGGGGKNAAPIATRIVQQYLGGRGQRAPGAVTEAVP